MTVVVMILPRMIMPLGVATIFLIANGLFDPVLVVLFPVVEIAQTIRWHRQPDLVRTQVIILVTDESDVFRAVPGVTIRHADCHSNAGRDWSRRHYNCRGRHGRWSYDDWRRRRRFHDYGRSRDGC